MSQKVKQLIFKLSRKFLILVIDIQIIVLHDEWIGHINYLLFWNAFYLFKEIRQFLLPLVELLYVWYWYFSEFNVHLNHSGIFLKCMLWFCKSEIQPEILHFQQVPRWSSWSRVYTWCSKVIANPLHISARPPYTTYLTYQYFSFLGPIKHFINWKKTEVGVNSPTININLTDGK